MLLFASAGVLHHSGIKIPFFAFFAHDAGLKPKEAPINMQAAMVLSSVLCILIGIFPSLFYQILPYSTYYQPYDFSHVLSQLQLLMFAVFAFICLWHFKIYPPELNSTVLNSDWFYRVLFYKIINFFVIQSLVASTLSLLGSLIVEDISKIVFSSEAISAILITGILGTTFALLVMIWAQKILSASETAIIIAMEPVFAALFSVYFGYEVLGFLSYLGATIVVCSIIFCEVSRNTELAN